MVQQLRKLHRATVSGTARAGKGEGEVLAKDEAVAEDAAGAAAVRKAKLAAATTMPTTPMNPLADEHSHGARGRLTSSFSRRVASGCERVVTR